jgi:hexokinase
MREKVLDFLSRHNQSSSQIDEERMIKGFIEAMEDGLNREDGQLEMIPSYLPVDSVL